MGAAYPELAAQRAHIEKVILQEEERFAETLAQGMACSTRRSARWRGKQQIPGETVFRLYDTYGFPVDLTNDIARERGSRSTRPASRRRWTRSARVPVRPASSASTCAAT